MAGWPAGALVPSSPKVWLGLDHRSAHAHDSPRPPSPAWLLRLAKISKQASSQQQHTLGRVVARPPACLSVSVRVSSPVDSTSPLGPAVHDFGLGPSGTHRDDLGPTEGYAQRWVS